MSLEKESTGDGSETFRHPVLGELYHTRSGAVTEALEKYSVPLKVWLKESPVLLDVCFGLGYNSAAAIDVIRQKGNNSLITIYCFENDREILRKVMSVSPGFGSYSLIKNFVNKFLEEQVVVFEEENVRLVMFFGDAREEVRKVRAGADYVFLDPFSPKKQPGLWTTDFMKDIFAAMKEEGCLATYSYARSVRVALESAGFKVFPGPVIGRRSPSTIACKHKKTL